MSDRYKLAAARIINIKKAFPLSVGDTDEIVNILSEEFPQYDYTVHRYLDDLSGVMILTTDQDAILAKSFGRAKDNGDGTVTILSREEVKS